MKRFSSLLLLTAVVLLFPSCLYANTLTSGQAIEGEFTQDVPEINYSFEANVGDVVLLALKTEDGRGRFIDLIAPDGSEVKSRIIDESYSEIDPLPLAGTYTLTLRNRFYPPGLFTLEFLLIGGAAEFSLKSGEIVQDEMLEGDIDSFSFEANAGEYFLLAFDSVDADAGDFFFDLYSPSGKHLTKEFSEGRKFFSYLSSSEEETAALPETGRYTLVIQGDFGESKGEYSFMLAQSGDTYPVQQIIESTYQAQHEIESNTMGIFAFEAKAGESIIAKHSSDITFLNLALFAPDGSVVDFQDFINSNSEEIEAPSLPQDGRYTLIVRSLPSNSDIDGAPGPYSLSFHKAPGISDGVIVSGIEKSSSLLAHELDSFNFAASIGDDIAFTLESDKSQKVSIFSPDGTPINADIRSEFDFVFDPELRLIWRTTVNAKDLVFDGNYTIMIRSNIPEAHDYSIIFNKVGNGIRGLKPECKQPFDDCGQNGGNSGFVGNPINFAYGFKAQKDADFAEGRLRFVRYYRSDSDWTNDALGERWRHNFYRHLNFFFLPNNGPAMMEITDGSGAVGRFQFDNGSWVNTDPDRPVKFEPIVTDSKVSGYVYTTAADTREIYDLEGKLIRLEYRGREALDLHYDDASRLFHVKDENGRTLQLNYNSQSRIEKLTTPDGDYQYIYDNNNNLLQVIQPDFDTLLYHYEDTNFPHALTGMTDENQIRVSTYGYDAEGRVNLTQHAGGAESYSVVYNDDGTVTTTNPLGKETIYHFEEIQGLKRITLVEGQATQNCAAANHEYKYNEDGYLKETKDWEGNVTEYIRNNRGLVETLIEAKGTSDERTTTFTYTDDFRLPDIVKLDNEMTDTDYDADGRITSVTIKDTDTNKVRTTTRSYYPNTIDEDGNSVLGRLHTINGSRMDVSDITTFVYDDHLRLVKTTNALGHQIKVKNFDSSNRPTLIEDENNIQTILTYDTEGRLKSSLAAVGTPREALTQYDYYPNGLVETLTLPNNATLTYGYDDAQRLISVTDSLGNRIHYQLDAAGNREKTEYSDANEVLRFSQNRKFDELSRLIESVAGNGDKVSMDYDLNSNLEKVVDGNLNKTEFAFDALDRLIKETDADDYETDSGYDEHDRVKGVTNARGHTTSYQYNAFGDLLKEMSPDTGETTYTYDSAGNVKTQTDARGVLVEFDYDALNRRTAILYPSQSDLNMTYIYDAGTNCGFGVGRLCKVTYKGGSTNYHYDELGRIIEVNETRGDLVFTTLYAYDKAGVPTGMTYPSGRTSRFKFNANAQISDVFATINGSEIKIAGDIEYLPFGALESLTYGNGIQLQNTFNQAYQLEQRQIGNLANYIYDYDNAGNIKAINTKSYDYDNLYRLIFEDNDTNIFEYLYDPIGGREQKTEDGNITHYEYSPDNQHLLELTGAESKTIEYDERGNTKVSGDLKFEYNAANRLSHLENGDLTAHYRYDHRGLRFYKQVNDQSSGDGQDWAAQAEAKFAEAEILQTRADEYQMQAENFESQIVEPPSDTSQARLNQRLRRQAYYANRRASSAQTQADTAEAEAEALQELANQANDGKIIYYAYGLLGQIIGEYDQEGQIIREYLHLNGEPLAQIDANSGTNNETLIYLHTDHLATPRFASYPNAQEVWRWESDAFGNGEPVGTAEVNLRFPGQYFDGESHLYYNWHRYYEPVFGRYLKADPIGLRGGINNFSYVDNDSLNSTDFFGLKSLPYGLRPVDFRIMEVHMLPRNIRRLDRTLQDYLPDDLREIVIGPGVTYTYLEVKRCNCSRESELLNEMFERRNESFFLDNLLPDAISLDTEGLLSNEEVVSCPMTPRETKQPAPEYFLQPMSEDDPNCYCRSEYKLL